MSKLKWFTRAPATEPQYMQPREGGDPLPEVFTAPEVIHGSGGDADWALWDECVAAWDRSATLATVKSAA